MIKIENMKELKDKLPCKGNLEERRWHGIPVELTEYELKVEELKKKKVDYDPEISEFDLDTLEDIIEELNEEKDELEKLREIVKLVDKYIYEDNSIWGENNIVRDIIQELRQFDCKVLDGDSLTNYTNPKDITIEFLEKNFFVVNVKKLIDECTDREGVQEDIYYYLKDEIDGFEDVTTTTNLLIDKSKLDDITEQMQDKKENCINYNIDKYKKSWDEDGVTEDDLGKSFAEEIAEIRKEYVWLYDDMIDKIEEGKTEFNYHNFVYNSL